jgi:hypothetical protein
VKEGGRLDARLRKAILTCYSGLKEYTYRNPKRKEQFDLEFGGSDIVLVFSEACLL